MLANPTFLSPSISQDSGALTRVEVVIHTTKMTNRDHRQDKKVYHKAVHNAQNNVVIDTDIVSKQVRDAS